MCALQGRGDRSIEGEFRYELYNLEEDPGEETDLSAQYPERVEAMKASYDTWFEDVTAPLQA